MLVVQAILMLFILNFGSALKILATDTKNTLVTDVKRPRQHYFPGIHQSINSSGITFSYNDSDEFGNFQLKKFKN